MVDKLTLFEFHLDEFRVTNNAPGAGTTTGAAEDALADDADEPEETDGDLAETGDGSGRSGLVLLGVFALLVLLAAVAKKLMGEDPELDDLADLDDFAE